MMDRMNFVLMKQLSHAAREGHPKGNPIRPMNIRVPDPIRARLARAVARSGVSQTDIINGALAAALPEESE